MLMEVSWQATAQGGRLMKDERNECGSDVDETSHDDIFILMAK